MSSSVIPCARTSNIRLRDPGLPRLELPRVRFALPFDPASLDGPRVPRGLPVDSIRSAIDDAVRTILGVLGSMGLLGAARRMGESPRAEDQVRDYLESEVLGASHAEIGARRGITPNAALKSIARGRELVESTRGRLERGGFSSPLAAAGPRERGPRNEPSW
jgi:hypothetical protein